MDYEWFKVEVLRLTGIDLNCYKERQMKRRIEALVARNECDSYKCYIELLISNKDIYEEFINYITINVSEFFRNPGQWETLEKDIIPSLLSSKTSIRVWSSACSTGDEPYTLTMLLTKFFPIEKIKVLATDIDLGVIEKAKIGKYDSKSLANVPTEFMKQFFIQDGNCHRVCEKIKNCVEFKKLNLLEDSYPGNCDLILCRNVLIYFTEEAKNKIYEKFNRSLNMGGILFVGSTEQIISCMKYGFISPKTFFYQKEAQK